MTEQKTKVVWREWYNEGAVKKMEEMGTLPHYESFIDIRWMQGDDVAVAIAEDTYAHDAEQFREGGEIVILEPAEFAGAYDISVDYEPRFSAYGRSD